MMTFKKGLLYVLLPIYKPTRQISAFFNDKHKVGYAVLALFILGLLYTFTIVVGYLNGFGAAHSPWLAIPPEDYYLWESFFALPVYFVSVILFAGTARLLSMLFRGTGSFEHIFAIYAIALVFPTVITMWIPETTLIVFFPDQRLMPLGGFAVMPMWLDTLRQLVGGLWPVVIAVIGIRKSEHITWWQSGFVTFCAAIPTVIFILVFIR